jgi:two-component system osmolarity sensor histidine kinase EnvZ
MTTTVDQAEAAGTRPKPARKRFNLALRNFLPTGLYARSLIIVIAPVVLLQALVAFVFMERHWLEVVTRLSGAMVADIAAIADVIDTYPQDADFSQITRIAKDRLDLDIALLPADQLPETGLSEMLSPLNRVISRQLDRQIDWPYWVETDGPSIEIRVKLDNNHVLQVLARRSQTHVSNSLIFASWMAGSSVILLAVAIIFLRNQIRPILALTDAVDNFGKGRPVPDFQPRGAREIRHATAAFHQMRQRVERQIEQRTAMLSGVSHDLRTMLTRFRLELALIEETADVAALKGDVDDMNRMLEGYLAFARGDLGEATAATDMAALIGEAADAARLAGRDVNVTFTGDPAVSVRPQAFRRCIANLVANAARHGRTVAVAGVHADGHLTVTVDDDGPGVPPAEREAVFKPFYRRDDARNLDESGTGLGLSIARDIARNHGGDITLSDSPLSGLRATVTVPA